MQSQIYFAHWVIFWSKCDGLWLGQTNICVVYWLHLYVYLKKSKYLLFLCRRITSVHCWWPVVVNGAVFMRKKVDSLVMWWRSSLVNSINVSLSSQFPGWLLHFVVYWSETVPHCCVQSRAIVIFLKGRIILLERLGPKKDTTLLIKSIN